MSLSPQVVHQPGHPPLAVPTEPIWPLTVGQYHEMVRAGILSEDDPVELLEGWLVTKMVKNPPHCAATELVRKALEHALPPGLHVQTQEPVTLATSEPEPDAAIVRGGLRDYPDRHPGASDVILVVEVADASLERDRTLKSRVYAEAGIPAYWIVNLLERRLEVHGDPSGPSESPGYRTHQVLGPEEHVPLVIDGEELARIVVADLLP
jgi:Uma2 family endonuclease